MASTAADHANWHAARLATLSAADGWLTLVGLTWFDEGMFRIGSGAECEVTLPRGPALLGTLHIERGAARWMPAVGTPCELQTDVAGKPTVIAYEGLSFFLIERDDGLGLRLRDVEAPTRRDFKGIDCFAFDPSWQIAADWDGQRAQFDHESRRYSLRPQDATADKLQFVFADATSGRKTYGGGRFLYAARPEGDTFVLDFNRAINPPCAFTPFAVCPLPPAENRLPFAVTAGEKIWRKT